MNADDCFKSNFHFHLRLAWLNIARSHGCAFRCRQAREVDVSDVPKIDLIPSNHLPEKFYIFPSKALARCLLNQALVL